MEIKEIKGLDKLNKKLKSMQGAELQKELVSTTQDALLYVQGQVPPYPAPPLMSSYSRTGTLGRQITIEVRQLGSEVAGVIGSPTPYSPWVISSEKVPSGKGPQAWMHEGRWWTLQGVVSKARDEVVKFYEKMVDRLVSRD